MSTILMAIAAAVLGGLIFTVVGIIPGTDETATMVPLTIILILAGVPVGVLFAWEIGIIVAMQVSHTIPTGQYDGSPHGIELLDRKTAWYPSYCHAQNGCWFYCGHYLCSASGHRCGADPVPLGRNDLCALRTDLYPLRSADRLHVLCKMGRDDRDCSLRYFHPGPTTHRNRRTRLHCIYLYFHGYHHWPHDL